MWVFLLQAADQNIQQAQQAAQDLSNHLPTYIVQYQIVSTIVDCAYVSAFLLIISFGRLLTIRWGRSAKQH